MSGCGNCESCSCSSDFDAMFDNSSSVLNEDDESTALVVLNDADTIIGEMYNNAPPDSPNGMPTTITLAKFVIDENGRLVLDDQGKPKLVRQIYVRSVD